MYIKGGRSNCEPLQHYIKGYFEALGLTFTRLFLSGAKWYRIKEKVDLQTDT